jgi:hypothetical protein
MTFDPRIGEEVCGVYMEDPDYAEQFSEVRPFNLVAHKGLVRTPYRMQPAEGPAACVW